MAAFRAEDFCNPQTAVNRRAHVRRLGHIDLQHLAAPSGPVRKRWVGALPFKPFELRLLNRVRFPLKGWVLGTKNMRHLTYGISDKPSGGRHHSVHCWRSEKTYEFSKQTAIFVVRFAWSHVLLDAFWSKAMPAVAGC